MGSHEFGMKQGHAPQTPRTTTYPGLKRLALTGGLVVFAAYAFVLWVSRDLSLVEAAVGSLANTVPTVLFALVAYRIVGDWLIGRPTGLQIGGHFVLGAAYSVMTYWLLMVALGVVYGDSPVEFNVRPFPARESVWQLLQNFTTYGLVAALAYLHARPEPVELIIPDTPEDESGPALSRYFIRSGDDIRPIDVASIISIAGADDYAEVTMVGGRHLVRMTLAEFERSLDPARFIRVHRSRIVNADRVERAEPAGGGRLLLHMEGGEQITASRAGARLVRDRVI